MTTVRPLAVLGALAVVAGVSLLPGGAGAPPAAAREVSRPPVATGATPVGLTSAVRERRLLGRSAQGRPLYAYRKGSPHAHRRVVVLGQMHGNERGVRPTAGYLRRHAVGTGVDLWVVPTMNPDGAALRTRRNARGVDLNRNFPYRWRASPRGTATYGGPAAASEPETRALVRFLDDVDPTQVVSLHQPLYGVDASETKGRGLVRRLVRETGLPARSFTCSGVCHGTMTGWFNARHAGEAVTVEFGPHPTRSWRHARGRGILRAVGAR